MKKILLVISAFVMYQVASAQTTYTFSFGGNWSAPYLWANNIMPPDVLPAGDTVILAADCFLDVHQTIASGAIFIINPGVNFVVWSSFLITGDKPLLTTGPANFITNVSATLLGAVISRGGTAVTEKGICYATHPYVTINDSKVTDLPYGGPISVNVTGLGANTTYYYQSYAINGAGVAYGQQESFTTTGAGAGFVCGTPITVTHTAGDMYPVTKTVTYATVTPGIQGSNLCWITKNLGADQQAASFTDTSETSAGWYWQFNRRQGYKHDGATRTPNTTWITTISEALDWQAADDPCMALGTGWRLPTSTEWQNIAFWFFTNADAYASVLKIHAAGYISSNLLGGRGVSGLYWSGNRYNNSSGRDAVFVLNNPPNMTASNKQVGTTLRCVLDPAAGTPATLTTTPPSAITNFSATVGGNVSADGGNPVSARGICYSKTANPGISNSTFTIGNGVGTFSANLEGIDAGTLYYIRAYATNSAGTAYGNEDSFTTLKSFPSLGPVTAVSGSTGGVATGSVTSDGGDPIIERGFCYSLLTNPTIADQKKIVAGTVGNFGALISGVIAEKYYYMRSYAKNSLGISYSNSVGFLVKPGPCASGSTLVVTHNESGVIPFTKSVNYKIFMSDMSGSNKCWIGQNLGATYPASSENDNSEEAAGWYWQFNRKQGFDHNGTSITPNTGWNTNISENSDWIQSNDPCSLLLGTGWRIPTASEWTNAITNRGWLNSSNAFASAIKLHKAGVLGNVTPNLVSRGSEGYYWSTTQNVVNGATVLYMIPTEITLFTSFPKSTGTPLRCLQD